jgi:hypothetical protein
MRRNFKASFEFLVERAMQENQSNNSIKVGETGWISLRIEGGVGESEDHGIAGAITADCHAEGSSLFALAERAQATLPERYPRLTFLAIALFLLISVLTAEFEYLRGAGYSWP